jgi:starch synthase (maltosyl-transferring)
MADSKEPRKRAAAAGDRDEGRVRAVIDALSPRVDGGRFAAKRIAGEPVCVEAHCFTDGHDQLRVMLEWGALNAAETYEVEMRALGNDVWTAEFTPPAPGRYRCTVTAWVDHFESWRNELGRREELGDIRVALQVGSALIEAVAGGAGGAAPGARIRPWMPPRSNRSRSIPRAPA